MPISVYISEPGGIASAEAVGRPGVPKNAKRRPTAAVLAVLAMVLPATAQTRSTVYDAATGRTYELDYPKSAEHCQKNKDRTDRGQCCSGFARNNNIHKDAYKICMGRLYNPVEDDPVAAGYDPDLR